MESKIAKARNLAIGGLALSLVLLIPAAARANSLVHAFPASGSSLSVEPNAVSLTFSEPISEINNELAVYDPSHEQIDDGALTRDGATLVVGLKSLTLNGAYLVVYKVSTDGENLIEGSYTFNYALPPIPQMPTESYSPNLKLTVTSSSDTVIWGKKVLISVVSNPPINGVCTFNYPIYGGIKYLTITKANLIKGKSKALFAPVWAAVTGTQTPFSITVICQNAKYSGKNGVILLGFR